MSLKKIILSLLTFACALVLSLSFFDNLFFVRIDGISANSFVSMILFFATYLIVGLPVVKDAIRNICKGEIFDEKFLMSIASIGAILLGEYPEAVAVMLFYQIGEFFQDYAVDKSKDSIEELMKLRPDSATILQDGKEIIVSPEEVSIGQTIIVKPGEKIPLDGIVFKGKSFVDTSSQTGESVPHEIYEDSKVLAGFINIQGVIEIRITKNFEESSVSKIIKLVESATQHKSKSEKFITKFAKYYTPAVCLAAVIVALIPPLIFRQSFDTWIEKALTFLVVSCPCALVISIPLSFFSGIGLASKKGILVKGSNYLELLSNAKTAVFDKTGTLTKGSFVVKSIHTNQKLNISKQELLALATHAELYSSHPISKSLQQAHKCECCNSVVLENIEEISGKGIKTHIDNKCVLVGNISLMESFNVQGLYKCEEDDFGSIVHIAIDGQYAGHIVIADEIKEDSEKSIKTLRKLGVQRICMLTGDKNDVATKIASSLALDEVYSELLPENKLEKLEQIVSKKTSGSVIYVGDGINDAPSLARADVGIAMGALGSDAAIESANTVIMSHEVSKIAEAILIAKKTKSIVKQNIIFALGVKFLIMLLSLLGIGNMWIAVFGDVGVSLLAVLNAFTLIFFKH